MEHSDLTIVIPTHLDGVGRLLALLPHWDSMKLKLLIIDSSPESNRECFAKYSYAHLIVDYIHLPVLDSGIRRNYCLRLLLAASSITTPFVGLCGDDDVYTKSGIEEALKILRAGAHLDVIVGKTAMVSAGQTRGSISWRLHHTEPIWKDYGFRRSTQLRDRLHVEEGIGYYSIGRSDFFTRLWSFVFSQQDLHPYWFEYQIKWLTELGANIKVLPHLLWIRSPERPVSEPQGQRELMNRCSVEPMLKGSLVERFSEGLASLRAENPISECARISSELIETQIDRAKVQHAQSFTLERRVADYIYTQILNRRVFVKIGVWRFADWLLRRCGFAGPGLPRVRSSIVGTFVREIRKIGVFANAAELELISRIYSRLPRQGLIPPSPVSTQHRSPEVSS